MGAAYDPNNPLVKRLRQQTEAVQKQLADMHATTTRISMTPSPITTAMDQDMVTSQAELAPLKAQELVKRALIGVIGQKMQLLEEGDIRLRALGSRIADQNEDLKLVRPLYDQARIADQTAHLDMEATVQASTASVLDQPITPNTFLVMAAGVVVGLTSAYGMLIVSLSTHRKSLTADSSNMLLGLPVHAWSPLSGNDRSLLR